MRYIIGIIAGVVLIMGAIGGMENDTLNILYSLKIVVIGSILIYGCYMGRKEYRKKGRWVEWRKCRYDYWICNHSSICIGQKES